MDALKAGAARANITPAVGAITSGNVSAGITSELFAKALVLDDGKTKVALVTLDLCLMCKQIVAETRERIEQTTGIPGRCVMFASSHTHSGPVTMRQAWGTGARNVPDHSYLDQLVAKMAGAVAEADSRLVEAKIGVGEGLAPFNINRWLPTPDGPTGARWAPNADAPTDETLSVLRVDRPDGTPMASVVNFAAHASVASWGKYFCADFPGYMQETLEQFYGGGTTAMFANGASGDLKIKWLTTKEDGSIDFAYGDAKAARRWGRVIAGAALSVMEQIEKPEEDLRISASVKVVDLPMLPLPSVEEIEKRLAEKQKAGKDTAWEEKILPQLRDGTAPTVIPGEVQLIRLGSDVALLGVPGELFVEIGLRMRAELGCKHLFIVGYANGYTGYLPTAESCIADGMNPRYNWHEFFWYPACFCEGVEPALMGAAKELLKAK
ncbi:MAG: neutral/alkaline non-lysosomal ceramidase N-terminal domain-containing protein [Phycisphaerae bacterium]|nr:neutral/alkaline non-lysosomal ceramidase N-terminal domain-containing protein [Phycisphaerae bacterium]